MPFGYLFPRSLRKYPCFPTFLVAPSEASVLNSLTFLSDEMKQRYQTMWDLLIRAPGGLNEQPESRQGLLDVVAVVGSWWCFRFRQQVTKELPEQGSS